MTFVRSFVRWSALAAGLFLLSSTAWAQNAGVRVGVSSDPTQFYFGGHFETAPLIPHLRFRPNVEIGVGHSLTLITANFEFAYYVPIPRQPWSVYFGGGPSLVISEPSEGESDTGGGLNLLVGLAHRQGLFTELKLGLGDSPDVKFAVGYTFRL